MKKSEVKLKSADEVNYLASSYICGADVLILPYLLDQTPRLLFISSRNFVRLLFESGY